MSSLEREPSTPLPPKRLDHVATEGLFSIPWPLAPRVAAILQYDISSDQDPLENILSDTVSRSALSSILERGVLLFELCGRAVVRVAPSIVGKIGRSNDITEIMNLHHIRMVSSSIPVPEPLGLILIDGNSYMFSSFVEGTPLDRIWQTLATPQKEDLRR